MYSSGVMTSTSMTGSSSLSPACLAAFWTAMEPAILKAISDESTSWYVPSSRIALTSTTGDTGQDPVFEGLFDSLIDRGDVLPGNPSTRDLVDELVAAAGAGRFQADDDMAVLALAAGLPDVLALDLGDRPLMVSR